MQRILLTIGLIAILYFLGQFVFSQAGSFIQNASLVVTGISKTTIERDVRAYLKSAYNDSVATAEISFTYGHIDLDDTTDVIARIISEETCGTGGCMTIIMLQNELHELKPVSFGYSVKNIEIVESVTNGMHDVRINNDKNTTMQWDGEQYTLNEF